ncbi:RNA 2',3'-cyclic phosphodiesterase [Candidatus Bathyarchaeota archaeon]|nr:RNA 2',3'-cyclic phosphodiesterase [Candidatus Bathyarchaeota archaeon]
MRDLFRGFLRRGVHLYMVKLQKSFSSCNYIIPVFFSYSSGTVIDMGKTDIRSFIALDIKEGQVLKEIERVQAEFDRMVPGKIKFVELENLHVTLKFLGERPPSEIRRIHAAIQEIDPFPAGGIKVLLKGVGVFNKRRPRVLWTRLIDTTGTVDKAFQEIEDTLEGELGIEKERRKFKAHLTIARIRRVNDLAVLHEFLGSCKDRVMGEQILDRISYKQSVLTPQGPIYSEIEY